MAAAHSHDGRTPATRSERAEPGTGDPDTVGSLVEQVGRGDREALDAVYDRLADSVYGLARRVLRSSSLAEEVTQDVFVEVWAKAPTFDASRGSALTWILSLAHRKAAGLARETSARERSAATAVVPQRTGPVLSTFAPAQARPRAARDEVGRAMSSLNKLDGVAIQLAYFRAFTSSQVAESLGLPVAAVETRIRDGLRLLSDGLLDLPTEGVAKEH